MILKRGLQILMPILLKSGRHWIHYTAALYKWHGKKNPKQQSTPPKTRTKSPPQAPRSPSTYVPGAAAIAKNWPPSLLQEQECKIQWYNSHRSPTTTLVSTLQEQTKEHTKMVPREDLQQLPSKEPHMKNKTRKAVLPLQPKLFLLCLL